MSKRAYLSDVSPWWTMERQEQALADVLPGALVFRDPLDVRQRRGHRPEQLEQRKRMLRATTRPNKGETIYVASLAVLAWSEDDFRAVLAAIEARGAALVSVDDGAVVDPVAAWKAARVKSRLAGAAVRGGQVSAERRKAASAAGVRLIADRWPLPSQDYPTADLLEEAGLSLNTVKAHLGPRPIAQYKHKLKLARKQRAEKEKAS